MPQQINKLFSIKYPIVQAGMVWCSGWELASAVSNAGGLGLLGSGSMTPEILREQIQKTRESTIHPFGVNVPLIYSRIEETMKVIVDEKIPIVFTSAGNPATWTQILKDNGIVVVHVVSNLKFALKAVQAGADAIVAEGVEAGGHNGREETTTFCLLPLLRQHIHVPIIAAGGIASGAGIMAAMALGADGVQIGSLFASSLESSSHPNFKNRIIQTGDGGTRLALRSTTPVRLIKNEYSDELEKAELKCTSPEELKMIKGTGKSKLGMFDGDIINGELEIGQVAAIINRVESVNEIFNRLKIEYHDAIDRLKSEPTF